MKRTTKAPFPRHPMTRRPGQRSNREVLATWLNGHPWDLWCTFTFRQETSVDGAMRHFRRWHARNCRKASAFAAVERGGRYGRVHLHGLLGQLGIQRVLRGRSLQELGLWQSWFNSYGRAQLLPYEPERGLNATFYIAKYLTKAPDLWDAWNIGAQL